MPPSVTSAPERPHVGTQERRRPTFVRRLLHTFLRFVTVLTLAALCGGAWYLAKRGFSRSWRNIVVEELHRHGVEVSVRRLTLDPFRGLVAQGVRVYDYKNRATTLALVSEISLDINYAALLRHEPFLNAIDIRNGEATVPLPEAAGKAERAQLRKFRAHIYFAPDEIDVSQAEGIFCGVHVSAKGQLINRASAEPSPETSAEEMARRLRRLQSIVAALQQFRHPGNPPELQVKFSGDLSAMEHARVQATLRGGQVQRAAYEARNLAVAAEWRDQTFTVSQCEWSDRSGHFSGRTSWSRQSGDATFQARGNIDLKALLDSLGAGAPLVDCVFTSAPQMEISGNAHFGDGPSRLSVIGHIATERFSYRDVPFEGAAADVAWDGERTMAREIRLRHRTGALSADLLSAPGDFRLHLQSAINPGALTALAPANLRPFLAQWEWARPPEVRLKIHGPSTQPATWEGEGSIALDRTRFRGVWMKNASVPVRFGDGTIAVENFHVTRDEGVGTGSVTYDSAKREIRLTNVKSTLNPADVIFWIEPRFWKNVAPYKFTKPPNVTANGVVQFGSGKETHLEIGVDAPAGMEYVFVDRTLPFTRASGRLLFTDDRLQINDLATALYSGTVKGAADISLAKNDHHYSARVEVEDVDFPSLTDLYFKYDTAHGSLAGNYEFTGRSSDPRTMRGSGKVRVTNGNVFAIPIFGPLSGLLDRIFAGAGYSVAHQGSAAFTINEGVFHTDNLSVVGKVFGMIGHGDVHFLDNRLDLEIRIDANGAGAVLSPVYKLFEYRGEGTLSKPVWKPKRF